MPTVSEPEVDVQASAIPIANPRGRGPGDGDVTAQRDLHPAPSRSKMVDAARSAASALAVAPRSSEVPAGRPTRRRSRSKETARQPGTAGPAAGRPSPRDPPQRSPGHSPGGAWRRRRWDRPAPRWRPPCHRHLHRFEQLAADDTGRPRRALSRLICESGGTCWPRGRSVRARGRAARMPRSTRRVSFTTSSAMVPRARVR